MAVIETWYNQDLQQPVKVHHIDGSMFSHNGNGNRIGVRVYDDGEPVTLAGTVSGYVITSDGSTVPCVGARSGHEATITIPPAAYQPGSAFITIFLTDGSTVTTLCAAQTNVLQARTGSQVSPGSVVTDWTQTINAAMQSVEDAAENLGGIIATPYASLTYPVPLGKYTYYNNGLYRCITPIAESEEFTAAHWTQVRLGDDVANLNSAIVSKKGENQVTPQNLEGMQFTKTADEVEGENIFTSDMLFREGQYVVVDGDGNVGVGINASFNAYCIPVEQNKKYKFTTSRFVVLATGNTVNRPAIGTTQSNISEIETGSASYLFLSIDINSISNIYVKPVNVDWVYSDFILPDWLIDNLPIPTVVEKPKFAVVTSNIASGGNLQLTAPKNNLRKGERIVFEGKISSFDSLRIGLSYSTAVGTDSNQINTFRIDGTNISYYAQSNSSPVTVAHGLTLANNIQIIWEMSAEASVKLTLISNGNMFAHVFTNFTRQVIGNPFVLSVGTVLTDCKLTWTCNDIDKDIWMFGDSYFAYSANRWTYYLHQYGYDKNCLLDGFPGEGGVNGRVAFNNLLQYGTPKVAVWCLGMNDGSDSNSAPSADWTTQKDFFLQYCQNNNVTPVFATIPTVPTISHEQKNAWIRSSGYRYIDFAKAVGANASGVWYGNMLSSDGVHPSETGAKALFAQVLIDLPEIMVGGYGTPTSV